MTLTTHELSYLLALAEQERDLFPEFRSAQMNKVLKKLKTMIEISKLKTKENKAYDF